MAYPEWVEKQKRPGTNISCSKEHYYLYEVSSVWDKEKKSKKNNRKISWKNNSGRSSSPKTRT